MSQDKPLGVGLSLRRGGARLRAMSKAHSPLHVLLWQARETEKSLLAAASSQKRLFSDLSTWASAENRALSDVCASFGELNALAIATQVQLANAYKSFRKDMTMVLEGEKRSDAAQRKLNEADGKRLKARKLVLQAQCRTQITAENIESTGDYGNLQTQLSEAEREAERANIVCCETKAESEAVKLVILRSTLSKITQSQLCFAHQLEIISRGGEELLREIPDPPQPGDFLSCVRYTGFNSTRSIVAHVKAQSKNLTLNGNGGPLFTSTELRSPPATSSRSPQPRHEWDSPSPTAPQNPFLASEPDPPPPYNTSFTSSR